MKTRHGLTAMLATIALALCGMGASAQMNGYQNGYFMTSASPVIVLGSSSLAYLYNGMPMVVNYAPHYTPSYVAGYDAGYDTAAQQNLISNAPVARTKDAVEVLFEKGGRLRLRWEGDSSVVRAITFATLDADLNPLQARVVTRLPAEARLLRTDNTAYYKVVVKYLNGTTTSVISPL